MTALPARCRNTNDAPRVPTSTTCRVRRSRRRVTCCAGLPVCLHGRAGGFVRFTGTARRPLRRLRRRWARPLGAPHAPHPLTAGHPEPCTATGPNCSPLPGAGTRRPRQRRRSMHRGGAAGTGRERPPGRAIRPPEPAPRPVPRRASWLPERAAPAPVSARGPEPQPVRGASRAGAEQPAAGAGRRPSRSRRERAAAPRARTWPARAERRRPAAPGPGLPAEPPAVAGAAAGLVRELGRSAVAAERRRPAWAFRRPPSYRRGPGPGARYPASGSCPACGPPRPAPAPTAPRAHRVPAPPSARCSTRVRSRASLSW